MLRSALHDKRGELRHDEGWGQRHGKGGYGCFVALSMTKGRQKLVAHREAVYEGERILRGGVPQSADGELEDVLVEAKAVSDQLKSWPYSRWGE